MGSFWNLGNPFEVLSTEGESVDRNAASTTLCPAGECESQVCWRELQDQADFLEKERHPAKSPGDCSDCRKTLRREIMFESPGISVFEMDWLIPIVLCFYNRTICGAVVFSWLCENSAHSLSGHFLARSRTKIHQIQKLGGGGLQDCLNRLHSPHFICD